MNFVLVWCAVLCCDRYNDAMATIRRVPSVEHHFQLVITRVYEEGDEELFEGEEESAFGLRSFICSFSWTDLDHLLTILIAELP